MHKRFEWDLDQNVELQFARGLSFEQVQVAIEQSKYIIILVP